MFYKDSLRTYSNWKKKYNSLELLLINRLTNYKYSYNI